MIDISDSERDKNEDKPAVPTEEEPPFPKWEWLLVMAAAFRTFLPIFFTFIVLLLVGIFLMWHTVLFNF